MKRVIIINYFYYQIAGLAIAAISNRADGYYILNTFRVDHPSDGIDLEMVIRPGANIVVPQGKILSDDLVKWVCVSGEPYTTSVCLTMEDTVIVRADVNTDWSRAEITYLQSEPDIESLIAGFLFEIIFRNRLLFKRGVVIHASAVAWEDQGIVFTAPSGTGKSTQAGLWVEHMQALVLNDDRPAICLTNNSPWIYGTPWSGSKTLYSNGAKPLRNIVVLEQASENEIVCLPVDQAVAKIMPRCFLPYYDHVIMGMCLDTLSEVISNVSLYSLKCRPGREAADLLHRYLKINLNR